MPRCSATFRTVARSRPISSAASAISARPTRGGLPTLLPTLCPALAASGSPTFRTPIFIRYVENSANTTPGRDVVADPDRYAIVSVDGHAGAELRAYKPYLASRWHDEFDAWADAYVNPFADLLAPTAYRNWDSERRLKETESDGIVA